MLMSNALRITQLIRSLLYGPTENTPSGTVWTPDTQSALLLLLLLEVSSSGTVYGTNRVTHNTRSAIHLALFSLGLRLYSFTAWSVIQLSGSSSLRVESHVRWTQMTDSVVTCTRYIHIYLVSCTVYTRTTIVYTRTVSCYGMVPGSYCTVVSY